MNKMTKHIAELIGIAALVVALGGLGVVMTGCSKQVHAPIPGSANAFDSDTYLALATIDGTIQGTRAELANNSFSPSVAEYVKKALNDLIASYDVADTTYQAYHAAALAGTATPAMQAEVQANVDKANADAAKVSAAKGGK